MSRTISPQFFHAPAYDGFWLPYDGDRLAFRARIETLLRRELGDPGGRLEVRGDGPHWIGSQVFVSYSHSETRALVVYSRMGAIGVDIEREDRHFSQPPAEVARRFFHASECVDVTDSSSFLNLWCRKEALAKQTRAGLRQWLSRPLAERSAGVVLEPVPVVPEGWVAWVAVLKA
jgi:hypothetical protein